MTGIAKKNPLFLIDIDINIFKINLRRLERPFESSSPFKLKLVRIFSFRLTYRTTLSMYLHKSRPLILRTAFKQKTARLYWSGLLKKYVDETFESVEITKVSHIISSKL